MKTIVDDADLYQTIFAELKHMGVKVPKVKKFKSGIPKQDKCSGKLKNRIFGVQLADQEWVSGPEGLLPKFIAESTKYLLKYSKEVGLFRKAGSVARQRNLRAKLENGENLEGSDANDVASLLKQWLRELPEPLIPHYMQDLFIRCLHLDYEGSRITASLLASLLLPPDHLHTLRHLLCFLEKFASDSNENKMDTYNLALMMAPNIFVAGSEIADKNSNSLVPLHTSSIQLLIENASKIGEVPSSVSFQHSVQEGKSGSELDSSTDILDFSPSKSRKKRKSGQLHDIITGIKKLVGQNATPGTSVKMTPEKLCNARIIAPKSASKRKAGPDQQVPSSVKKLATSAINAENDITVTPKTKDNGNTDADCRSANRHARRKSFGLLRRKERKRQKSAKSRYQENLSAHPPNHSVDATGGEPSLQVSTPSNENHLKPLSPLQCTFEDFLKSVNMKKSASDCYLTPSLRKFSKSPKPASVSYSRLQDKLLISSPYWLRSDKTSETHKIELEPQYHENELATAKAAELKATQAAAPSKMLHTPRRSPRLNADFNINASCKPENDQDICKKSAPNEKQDSKNTFPCSLLSDSLYGLNNSVRKRSFSTGSKLIRKAAITRQEAFILKTRNKTDSAENVAQNCEGEVNKQGSRIRRIESVLSNAKVNSNCVDKDLSIINLSRNGSRQGSIIRGRPNSVKTGLLSQSLKNKPVLPSLNINEIDKSQHEFEIDLNKVNSPVQCAPLTKDETLVEGNGKQDLSLIMKFDSFCISPENASAVDKDSDSCISVSTPEINVSFGQKLRSSNNSVEKTQKLKRKLSLPMNLEVDDTRGKVPKLRSSLEIVSADTVSDCAGQKFETQESCAFDASGCFKIPAPSKETTFDISNLEISMDDSCFKTPRQNPSSPNSITWVSGTKFLGFCSPEEDDNFNKRESIALILKNKSGHVQEKVSLYDNRIRDSIYCTRSVQSCSTPYIAFSINGNPSRIERSPTYPSRRHLQNLKKKPLSHSRSCDSTGNERNRTKGRKSQKSPLALPPKFVVTDMDTPSPKINHPLKEVTNICLGLNESNHSQNNTPGKNEATHVNQSPCNVDNTGPKSRKLARNSFSGLATQAFSKRVSRSESSPCRSRQNKKQSGFVQGRTHRPSLPIRNQVN